jgi:hypothetical protein
MSFIQSLQIINGNAPVSRRRALLGLSLLALTACSRAVSPAKSADSNVAYYTCTMHPFVRSQDPKGTCPVCGMNLVAVLKSTAVALTGSDAPKRVHIAPERMQELGVTTEIATKRALPSLGQRLTISTNAVLPTGNKFIVFVDHGEGQLEPREIEVGVQSGNNYEVVSGLSEGDRVVCSANFLVDAESRIQGVLKTWGDQP